MRCRAPSHPTPLRRRAKFRHPVHALTEMPRQIRIVGLSRSHVKPLPRRSSISFEQRSSNRSPASLTRRPAPGASPAATLRGQPRPASSTTKSAMPCCLLYTVGQQLMHAKYFDYSRCPEDTVYNYRRRRPSSVQLPPSLFRQENMNHYCRPEHLRTVYNYCRRVPLLPLPSRERLLPLRPSTTTSTTARE